MSDVRARTKNNYGDMDIHYHVIDGNVGDLDMAVCLLCDDG